MRPPVLVLVVIQPLTPCPWHQIPLAPVITTNAHAWASATATLPIMTYVYQTQRPYALEMIMSTTAWWPGTSMIGNQAVVGQALQQGKKV